MIPEPGLVDKLLEVVTRQRMKGGKLQTKPFSPFDEDVFDMNPVVRSFFLRLLLKCRSVAQKFTLGLCFY